MGDSASWTAVVGEGEEPLGNMESRHRWPERLTLCVVATTELRSSVGPSEVKV